MERLTFLAGFALGLLVVLVYVVQCLRGVREFSLFVMVMLILSSAAVVGGALLVAKPFLSQHLRTQLTGLGFDLYCGIGGLSVVAVACVRIFREVFSKQRPTS